MSVVRALGIIGNILKIVSFGASNFGGGSESHSGSTIKVAVALDGPSGTSNAGGDLLDM
ncbi:hypothetical protein EYZ11_011690 [Aspergillus tanneri]|uniref:Uncharacterized protein n=1 Tax=Aspergillus tanneri TaxID=1220188 RepID=A0A4S3J248_9EURO|nr:hypothetical protein EYZ11_011690 [Aspergillus tanneri]